MSEKLLPCPFCGGEAFVATVEHPKENRPNEYRFHGQIMCYKCQATAGTTGFDLTHEEATKKAIAAWNRRTQPAEPLTHADKIRSMSNEELAVFFAKVDAALYRADLDVIAYRGEKANENLDWLRQPAEE